MHKVEYKKLLEGLVRRLRDIDDAVVRAAVEALGHLQGHLGDDMFNGLVKKLSYAHQQLVLKKRRDIDEKGKILMQKRDNDRMEAEKKLQEAQVEREAEFERLRNQRELHEAKERERARTLVCITTNYIRTNLLLLQLLLEGPSYYLS